jgi:hypothetical protein
VYTGIGYTEVIDHTAMEEGNWYEIVSLGSDVNWRAIGHDSNTPILGSELVYNGETIAGSSATVKRAFTPDLVNHSNLFGSVSLAETRSYLNVITLGEGLPTEEWLYFRFRPWDDYGAGFTSKVVSGYLEIEPTETTATMANRYNLDGGRDENELISIPTNTLVKNYKYRIEALGNSEINWVAIGADSPTLNSEFIYNGEAVSGGGTTVGKVKRVEIPFVLTEEQINSTNLINPRTNSSIVLPTDIEEGASVVLVNRSLEHNLYVQDSNGNQISIIRPNERAEIIRDDVEWRDDRGSVLSLE